LAEAKNLDKLNGQLFRARQQIIEQKYTEAVQLLRSALEKDKQNQPAWRMVGQLLISNNQHDYAGAAEAFGKAVEVRPDGVPSINGLVKAMYLSGNVSGALAQARKSETVAGSDPEFSELLLTLESEAPGGDKEKATRLRERIARINKDNKGNQVQLILLQMD